MLLTSQILVTAEEYCFGKQECCFGKQIYCFGKQEYCFGKQSWYINSGIIPINHYPYQNLKQKQKQSMEKRLTSEKTG
jgi:hypothetical protein